MGNTISFIGSHGKRLLNRYNAQFRALKFIEKEKLPSAPRHALPLGGEEDPMVYEHLLKKDPSLDNYLKDVYIKSSNELKHELSVTLNPNMGLGCGMNKISEKYQRNENGISIIDEQLVTHQKNSKRPLPIYSGCRPKNTFQEPVEKVKGLCTLSEFFEFRSAHENDPVENSATVIASNYSLDVKKVENILKYYSVFTVHQVVRKESTPDKPDEMPLDELLKMIDNEEKKKSEEEQQKSEEEKKKSKDTIKKDTLQLESRQAKN